MAVGVELFGDRAVRCTTSTVAEALQLRAELSRLAPETVVNVVSGWSTVVVVFDGPGPQVRALADAATQIELAAASGGSSRLHELAISYDGPDLAEVAERAGLTREEVGERHAAREYTVAFLGFAPGFPYLTGLDPTIATPRRATARVRVEAGSVGIADDATGIYPAALPGGWQLIGHIDAVLFDPSRAAPSLLEPGDRVRFVPS